MPAPATAEDFMQLREVRGDQRPCWMVGCHGGAGTTTLARAIPEAADAGRYWPVSTSSATPSKVVLVARSNMAGLRAAQAAAGQWALGTFRDKVDVLGLAVIADAPGKLPRALKELLDVVEGGVPGVWYLPWVETLRLNPVLDLQTAPNSFRGMISELADLGWANTLHTVAGESSRSIAGPDE